MFFCVTSCPLKASWLIVAQALPSNHSSIHHPPGWNLWHYCSSNERGSYLAPLPSRFLWFTVRRFCCCCPSSTWASEGSGWVRSKDLVVFAEDEFYCLVLINHVNGHVCTVALRTHQSRPKDDPDVLRCHAIAITVLHHPATHREETRYCVSACVGESATRTQGQRKGLNL